MVIPPELQRQLPMVVKVRDKLEEIVINWRYLIGDYVNLFPKQFLISEYMKNLMVFLHASYREDGDSLRPAQEHIFRPFLAAPYTDLKVVLVTEYPVTTKVGNGLGLGNKTYTGNASISQELIELRNCIEDSYYAGFNIHFDWTLTNLAAQDFLLLNSALTCTKDDRRKHVPHWNGFITHLLKNLSKKNAGLVFAFIGDACKYAELIDEDVHFVIQEPESLTKCVENKEYWRSDIFNEINDAVFEVNNVTIQF